MTDTGVEGNHSLVAGSDQAYRAADTERPRLQLSYCTLLACKLLAGQFQKDILKWYSAYTESLKAAIRTALDQYGLEYPPPFVDDIARRWSKVLIKQTQLAVPLTSQTVLKCLDVALNARNLQHVYSDVHQPDLFLQALQAVAEVSPCGPVPDVVPTTHHAMQNFRSMDQTPWQSLDLPCDLPSIQILVTASLRVPAQHRMSVGQAINAVLNISTSFKWAGSARESLVKSGHNMMYEMQADKAHWAVSGRVSGEFRAEVISRFRILQDHALTSVGAFRTKGKLRSILFSFHFDLARYLYRDFQRVRLLPNKRTAYRKRKCLSNFRPAKFTLSIRRNGWRCCQSI